MQVTDSRIGRGWLPADETELFSSMDELGDVALSKLERAAEAADGCLLFGGLDQQ
jgi:hypothetical protein